MKTNCLLFSIICILSLSCSQEKKASKEEVSEEVASEVSIDEKVAENKVANEEFSTSDSAFVKSIIQELKGIEKYAVQDNFFLLSSLLEFKGDSSRHGKIKAFLQKEDEYIQEYYIELLDVKNGYIRFAPKHTEATYTISYWNLENDSKLIATEIMGCGPICSSSIEFQKFKNGVYQSIENIEIIPDIKNLPQMLVPDYNEEVEGSEPYEFKYELPQEGKNILFCLDNNCIDLQWNNEIFEIKEK